MAKYMYAGYPTAKVFEKKGGKKNIHELLWGDWVKITGTKKNGWFPVHARGRDGWMKAEDLQKERLLEMVFVDVGQGDGCLVVTPDDKHWVMDAGESDNMYRFLRWRYGGFKRKWKFEGAVITHPDKDHYFGFKKLFEEKNVSFNKVYHNGIIEAKSSSTKQSLGKSKDIQGVRYITEVMETQADLRRFLSNTSRWKRKLYPELLNTAVKSRRVGNISMLSRGPGRPAFVPGCEEDKDLSLEIIGPIRETDDGRRPLLRWFKPQNKGSFNKAQTKNGHSVVLKLRYHDISLILGGDLNHAAETFLLRAHVGRDLPAEDADAAETEAFKFLARETFECDLIKSCHHGSADFSNLFLESCNPVGTVVSSGDEESHAHPRSDTLGAIGKFGRGERPLIFSTELARSTREVEPSDLQKELRDKQKELASATKAAAKEKIKKQLDKITDELLKRNVTVYGAINLRTDGKKIVMAQKLEKERRTGSTLQKWDIYKMEPNDAGELEFAGSDR